MRVPARIVLAVLGADARGRAVGPAKHDRAFHLAAGHVARLGRRIDDLVDRLHGEIPGHEFDDRLQAAKGCADAEAGKAVFGDRRIDDTVGAEFLEQTLTDLVGALILRDLLAHQEDVAVAAHLLGHGVAQGLAHGHGDEFGALGHFGIGERGGLRRRGRRMGGLGPWRRPVRPCASALVSARGALARVAATGAAFGHLRPRRAAWRWAG